MSNVKNIAPMKCEQYTHIFFSNVMPEYAWLCGRPAKAERYFDDPKAKPMQLCGIHAN